MLVPIFDFSAELHDALLWLVEIGREKVLVVAPPRHPDGDGKIGEPPLWRRSHVDGLEIHWGLVSGPITTLPVDRLSSKSCARRSRRNVLSAIDRRKCRPGIKMMCAGYRALR